LCWVVIGTDVSCIQERVPCPLIASSSSSSIVM
jgi:hypothetical protein